MAAIDDNDGDSQQKAKYQLQARHLVADQFSFGTLNIRFASSVERWTGRIGFISYEPETNVLKLEQTKKIEENYTGSWTFEYEWVATVKIDLDGVRHLYYDEAQGENFWIKCGGGRNACIQYFVTVEDCSGKCRTPSDGIMEFRFIDDASRARALRDTFSYLIYDIGQAERAPR
ncbi:hypothetical protein ASD02_34465 [Ensifer sp. Root1252]|nr:hypothetical protein ASD02_34465 [Ensifer sp. Root1252]KRC68762.1 hypothetical protein ASE32_35295 [Ensifer sp. Root231]KRC93928.1 hypothetical protein ASE47_34960 [Ensifer sp. Root258]